MGSAIEQSHFISMLSKRTGIKEEIFWEDLKKIRKPDLSFESRHDFKEENVLERKVSLSYREQVEGRLAEIKLWKKELSKLPRELALLEKEEKELTDNLSGLMLRDDLNSLLLELSQAEASKDVKLIDTLTAKIQKVHSLMGALEERRRML